MRAVRYYVIAPFFIIEVLIPTQVYGSNIFKPVKVTNSELHLFHQLTQ